MEEEGTFQSDIFGPTFTQILRVDGDDNLNVFQVSARESLQQFLHNLGPFDYTVKLFKVEYHSLVEYVERAEKDKKLHIPEALADISETEREDLASKTVYAMISLTERGLALYPREHFEDGVRGKIFLMNLEADEDGLQSVSLARRQDGSAVAISSVRYPSESYGTLPSEDGSIIGMESTQLRFWYDVFGFLRVSTFNSIQINPSMAVYGSAKNLFSFVEKSLTENVMKAIKSDFQRSSGHVPGRSFYIPLIDDREDDGEYNEEEEDVYIEEKEKEKAEENLINEIRSKEIDLATLKHVDFSATKPEDLKLINHKLSSLGVSLLSAGKEQTVYPRPPYDLVREVSFNFDVPQQSVNTWPSLIDQTIKGLEAIANRIGIRGYVYSQSMQVSSSSGIVLLTPAFPEIMMQPVVVIDNIKALNALYYHVIYIQFLMLHLIFLRDKNKDSTLPLEELIDRMKQELKDLKSGDVLLIEAVHLARLARSLNHSDRYTHHEDVPSTILTAVGVANITVDIVRLDAHSRHASRSASHRAINDARRAINAARRAIFAARHDDPNADKIDTDRRAEYDRRAKDARRAATDAYIDGDPNADRLVAEADRLAADARLAAAADARRAAVADHLAAADARRAAAADARRAARENPTPVRGVFDFFQCFIVQSHVKRGGDIRFIKSWTSHHGNLVLPTRGRPTANAGSSTGINEGSFPQEEFNNICETARSFFFLRTNGNLPLTYRMTPEQMNITDRIMKDIVLTTTENNRTTTQRFVADFLSSPSLRVDEELRLIFTEPLHCNGEDLYISVAPSVKDFKEISEYLSNANTVLRDRRQQHLLTVIRMVNNYERNLASRRDKQNFPKLLSEVIGRNLVVDSEPLFRALTFSLIAKSLLDGGNVTRALELAELPVIYDTARVNIGDVIGDIVGLHGDNKLPIRTSSRETIRKLIDRLESKDGDDSYSCRDHVSMAFMRAVVNIENLLLKESAEGQNGLDKLVEERMISIGVKKRPLPEGDAAGAVRIKPPTKKDMEEEIKKLYWAPLPGRITVSEEKKNEIIRKFLYKSKMSAIWSMYTTVQIYANKIENAPVVVELQTTVTRKGRGKGRGKGGVVHIGVD